VFGNLIGNAVKFSPPAGVVTVRAEARGDEVRFAIADQGPGIAAEELPHIFERFWQARRTAHLGTGLGLSIAEGIVAAHGGRIWAESTPGAGTTMFFTLPRARRAARAQPLAVVPAARVPSTPRPRRSDPAGPLRVLLVDDEPDVRDLLGEMLEHEGYRVATARDGAEALAKLRDPPAPHLIILDLVMPGMNGWDFLDERSRRPELADIPVLVLSGAADVGRQVHAPNTVAAQKPLEARELLTTIDSMV
jgi:CheY-like chemotaxis protein